MHDDWSNDPPAPGSVPGGGRVDLAPEDLPEVRRLVDEGWELAPDAPVWAFLPAVWPRSQRTWVPDRGTRTAVTFEGTTCRRMDWTGEDYAERDADYASLCRDAGVADRPAGRLWLLRPPAGWTVQRVLEQVVEEVAGAGAPFRASPELTTVTRRVVARAFG